MSSTERVRQFRARNPGYDRRWKARYNGKLIARQAALDAQVAEAVAASRATLMLPAPVEDAAMAALNALAASLLARAAREPFPVPASPARPADRRAA